MSITGVVLVCTLIFLVSVPYFFRRKTGRPDSFIVGARDYGWWRLMAALSATYIGGAAMLNLPSISYTYGWYALSDVIPSTLGLLISGLVLAPVLRKSSQAVSLGTYLKQAGPLVAMVSGVLSTVLHTLIAAAQLLALTSLLHPFVPFGGAWLAPLVGALVAAYVIWGGYDSVTITDVVQFILMLVCFVGVVSVLLLVRAAEPASGPPILTKPMPTDMISLLALPLILVPCMQDTTIRIFAAKSTRHAVIGCVTAGFAYFLFGIIAVSIGVQSAARGMVLTSPDEITPIYLSSSLGAFAAIPLAGVLAAVVSVLDSMLFAAAASLAYDVPAWRKPEDARPRWLSPAVSTIAVLCVATTIALLAPRILSVILAALIIYVAVLLPLLIGVALRVPQKPLAILALFVLTFTTVNEAVGWAFPYRAFVICGAHLLVVGALSIVFSARKRGLPA